MIGPRPWCGVRLRGPQSSGDDLLGLIVVVHHGALRAIDLGLEAPHHGRHFQRGVLLLLPGRGERPVGTAAGRSGGIIERPPELAQQLSPAAPLHAASDRVTR